MPAVPVGPWMPMAYYPAYGIPAPYPEQQPQYAQPADQSGYYAPPHDTSGEVPVYATAEEDPVLYAEAVVEDEEPEPAVAVRPASAPVNPRTGARTPSAKVSPAGSKKPAASGLSAKGKKQLIIIGSAAAVVLVIAWLVFGRGRGSADSGGKAGAGLIGTGGPPKVIFELPLDRVFPPVAHAVSMHFVGGKGPVAERKDDKGNPAEPNPNEPVFEWRDVAPLANDNLLRSFDASADHSPRRVNWPSQPSVAGAKPNRPSGAGRVCRRRRPSPVIRWP